MGISDGELTFQRLLLRTRKSCREDLEGNVNRLKKAVQRLELIFIKLQGDEEVDRDVLMQYGRDLQQLKIIVEAESKKDVVKKLETLDSLPKVFPEVSSEGLRKRGHEGFNQDLASNTMVKAQTEATYRADIRRQLLGAESETYERTVEQHEQEQDYLANQLLSMTSQMKQQFTIAGEIIKEDNSRLDQMQRQTEDNKLNLDRESKILEHHAYKSCFDCMMLLIVVLVIWSFIGMVLVMKVFPKRLV
ncbi:unnamed protein product [Bursaphelenchus xylophilus]|uniref:Vesicle transport protein USE1 n=1 Tax=Bursaphelenchus xylophilus TaxID=6326 RepID=A0A1I7RL61_BURXY|nr:unnamed protein product [Bursaphelenchus xylophilus]CAG9083412.1 unnamed protein product [Bursaphelenchus xylophilus]